MLNKRKHLVLVTGGCGFIGSHVVDRLINDNFEVIVIDDLSTGKLENLNVEAIFYQGDVSDSNFVNKIFKQHKIKFVIHEATKINTNVLKEMPLIDVKSSINSTIVLAEHSIKYNIKNFIFASSVAVYGRSESLPASEDSLIDPIYSYGISKYTAESYLNYFASYYNLNFQILRYANVFGPRQPIYGEVGVIAIYTDRLINKEKLTIFGDGKNQRDYIYVSDIVEFTINSMFFDQSSTFNVGRGIPISVNQIFDLFRSYDDDQKSAIIKPARFGEIGSFYCDISMRPQLAGNQKLI